MHAAMVRARCAVHAASADIMCETAALDRLHPLHSHRLERPPTAAEVSAAEAWRTGPGGAKAERMRCDALLVGGAPLCRVRGRDATREGRQDGPAR